MKNLFYLLLCCAGLFSSCQQREKTVRELSEPDTLIVSHPEFMAEQLIIPGTSIGLTNINEDAAEVFKRLGKPDSGDAAMGKAVSVWASDHGDSDNQTAIYTERRMGVDDTSRVKMIRVTSPWFVTTEGIGTGKTLSDARAHFTLTPEATYSNDGRTYTIFNGGKGIAFEVNPDSMLTGIIVHDTGRTAVSGYIPFHPGAVKTSR